MKLICCLGNPGAEYHYTRHNIGFRIGEAICNHFNLVSVGLRHQGQLFSGTAHKNKILVLFPQTYMNRSGISLVACLNYYKIELQHALVIYDDIDIDFGRLSMKPRGGAGTHNGMKSIVQECKSTDFPRLRVGIGPKPQVGELSDFVLGRFHTEQESEIPNIQTRCISSVSLWIEGHLERAMAHTNKSPKGPQN